MEPRNDRKWLLGLRSSGRGPNPHFPFLGKDRVGEAERVPAEGSGAPAGVKRRAVEALRVKVGGKTRSGLSLTRPGPPTPFFVGEENERSLGVLNVFPFSTSQIPAKETSDHPPSQARDAPRDSGPGGVGPRGSSSSNVRAVGVWCAGRSPGLQAGGAERAHACGGRALPAPFLSAFAFPLPPRSSAASSEPPPVADLSFRGRWPDLPIY